MHQIKSGIYNGGRVEEEKGKRKESKEEKRNVEHTQSTRIRMLPSRSKCRNMPQHEKHARHYNNARVGQG